jgi:hypothetical protein
LTKNSNSAKFWAIFLTRLATPSSKNQLGFVDLVPAQLGDVIEVTRLVVTLPVAPLDDVTFVRPKPATKTCKGLFTRTVSNSDCAVWYDTTQQKLGYILSECCTTLHNTKLIL